LRELTDFALDRLRGRGVSYGDLRIVSITDESVQVKNGKVEDMDR